MEIKRVIDLIVELEKHDPVAPVEMWAKDGRGELIVMLAGKVQQMTPQAIKAGSYECSQLESNSALPVVVWVE